MIDRLILPLAIGVAVLVSSCTPPPRPVPIAMPETPAIVAEAEAARAVRTTIVGGEARVPVAAQSVRQNPRSGDIELNFPAADVNVVARAVLGDLLKVRYSVAPGASQPVTFVTPGPVARSSLLGLFETALKAAGLGLTSIDGNFLIQPLAAATTPATPATIGYGTEVIPLDFIASSELRKILDQVIPGVVSGTGDTPNTISIAGTTGQRSAARDLVKQFDVNWLRNMSFALFVPQRTDARLIAPEIDKLLNAADAPTRGLVRLIAMDKLNGILAISTQRQYLESVRRWVEILDREGESAQPRVFVYRVQNGRARDLAKTLQNAFGSGGDAGQQGQNDPFVNPATDAATTTRPADNARPSTANTAQNSAQNNQAPGTPQARISADEVNNAIVVFGTPKDFAVVEDALRKLDVAPAQVLIEAAITEVTLNDALRFGVQWNFQAGEANFALSEGGTPAATRVLPGFSFFYSNANNISATLNALESRTNIKVVSAPKILVLNNQTAALQVGDQVPILTQTSESTQNSDAPIINSVTYRDTGVILRITPRVNAGGLVLIDISQEVSDINPNASTGIDSPTISTRRVATTVAVQDGQVIAIGGLFRDSKSFTKAGLPILSRIPILGSLLFGRTNDTGVRTELIILLKPSVLRTADDGRAITEELRAKLRTLEPFKTEGRIP